MLVAIHGFTEDDLTWQDVLGSELGPLATPLLPGHGWSPCPPDTTLASTAAAIAKRYEGSEPFDLIGYSLGGRVAMQLANDFPHLVRRLMLVSCRPGIADDEVRAECKAQDEALAQILEEDGIGAFVAWWKKNPVLKAGIPLSRTVRELIRCRRLNQEPQGLANSLRCLGQGSTTPLWDSLHNFTMPCLLLAGSVDDRYSNAMAQMADIMPNAKLHIMDGCGHALHRESKDVLIRTMKGFMHQ